MSNVFRTSAILLSLSLLVSCASVSKSDAPSASQNPLGIKDGAYSALKNRSLLRKGNNFRLKAAIDKLNSGGTIYVTALGGSVTEGAGPKDFHNGYAYVFAQMLEEKYSDKGGSVILNNAGLSGTPSTLGLLRYEQDVEKESEQVPDILIVEFAVNDGQRTDDRAFEEIIRKTLLKNKKTAVIALYSAALYPNRQEIMEETASYYKIPAVSVADAVQWGTGTYLFESKDFFADIVHPTKEGHKIMADCLMNLILNTENAGYDKEAKVPDMHLKPAVFEGFTAIKPGDSVIKDAGPFTLTDSQCQIARKTGLSNFENNFYKKAEYSDGSIILELECKTFVLVYKENGAWNGLDFGTAEIFVDGTLAAKCNGSPKNGWNNCVIKPLIEGTKKAKHTVEIKMEKGSESKAFTIVTMGWS